MLLIEPLVSDAVLVIVILEPAVKLLPLTGLIIETNGNEGRIEAGVTVTIIGLEIVIIPFASVAWAVKV